MKPGDRVVALHPIWWPGRGTIAAQGQEGTIVAVGLDGRYGYANVTFGTPQEAVALTVAPVYRGTANVALVQPPR